MTSVQPPAKILVTGSSGFVAVWVLRTLIENGYLAVGTVRSVSKGEYLKNLFPKGFEYAVVEDIQKEDAFLEGLNGVTGVIHMASPVTLDHTGHPRDLIDPAVNGTVGILKTIAKSVPTVKRVVITSSTGSLFQPNPPVGYTYTENDWNDNAIKLCDEKGADAPNNTKYGASKTLAERAAWDFVKNNQVSFGLATILFPFALGPSIHQLAEGTTASTSAAIVMSGIDTERTGDDLKQTVAYTDVRDIALAHVKALSVDAAVGKRIIIAAGSTSWQDIYDELNSVSPPLGNIPLGKPGSMKGATLAFYYESDKGRKLLGIPQYRSLNEALRDTVQSARGAKDWRVQA